MEVGRKVFKEVEIGVFKKICFDLKCTLIYIRYCGRILIKKIKLYVDTKMISFKCKNWTKTINKLKYDFFTLLKFPSNSLPFNFWHLMFPWLNRERQEPQAWILFCSVLFPVVFPYVWVQGEATLSHEEG